MSNVCGTSRIVGCRFSLYPMSDRFVEIIMGALSEVNSTKVWMMTDDISTCIRGKESHVFDVVKAIYVHAAKTGVHVVFNGTFSIGCPGDTAGDVYMSEDDECMNESRSSEISVDVSSQFALYPLGVSDYMDTIYEEIERLSNRGLYTKGVHYSSRLEGCVHDVFDGLQTAFNHAQKSDSSHVVMTAVVSAHSPSTKKNN